MKKKLCLYVLMLVSFVHAFGMNSQEENKNQEEQKKNEKKTLIIKTNDIKFLRPLKRYTFFNNTSICHGASFYVGKKKQK